MAGALRAADDGNDAVLCPHRLEKVPASRVSVGESSPGLKARLFPGNGVAGGVDEYVVVGHQPGEALEVAGVDAVVEPRYQSRRKGTAINGSVTHSIYPGRRVLSRICVSHLNLYVPIVDLIPPGSNDAVTCPSLLHVSGGPLPGQLGPFPTDMCDTPIDSEGAPTGPESRLDVAPGEGILGEAGNDSITDGAGTDRADEGAGTDTSIAEVKLSCPWALAWS